MSSPAQRLAEAVRKRREELGDTQVDVAQRGGPSNATLTNIENGRISSLEQATARKLDVGLRWMSGSAKAVWDGLGEAVPLTKVGQLERMIAGVEAARMPADDKAHILRQLRNELEEEMRAGRERGERPGERGVS